MENLHCIIICLTNHLLLVLLIFSYCFLRNVFYLIKLVINCEKFMSILVLVHKIDNKLNVKLELGMEIGQGYY